MHIDIIWYDLYVLNIVHAPLKVIWIIFEVRYDISLFYKIEWVIVRLVLTPDDKKKLKSFIIRWTLAQISTDAPH